MTRTDYIIFGGGRETNKFKLSLGPSCCDNNVTREINYTVTARYLLIVVVGNPPDNARKRYKNQNDSKNKETHKPLLNH